MTIFTFLSLDDDDDDGQNRGYTGESTQFLIKKIFSQRNRKMDNDGEEVQKTVKTQ